MQCASNIYTFYHISRRNSAHFNMPYYVLFLSLSKKNSRKLIVDDDGYGYILGIITSSKSRATGTFPHTRIHTTTNTAYIHTHKILSSSIVLDDII